MAFLILKGLFPRSVVSYRKRVSREAPGDPVSGKTSNTVRYGRLTAGLDHYGRAFVFAGNHIVERKAGNPRPTRLLYRGWLRNWSPSSSRSVNGSEPER